MPPNETYSSLVAAPRVGFIPKQAISPGTTSFKRETDPSSYQGGAYGLDLYCVRAELQQVTPRDGIEWCTFLPSLSIVFTFSLSVARLCCFRMMVCGSHYWMKFRVKYWLYDVGEFDMSEIGRKQPAVDRLSAIQSESWQRYKHRVKYIEAS